jgi:hypothetical protein
VFVFVLKNFINPQYGPPIPLASRKSLAHIPRLDCGKRQPLCNIFFPAEVRQVKIFRSHAANVALDMVSKGVRDPGVNVGRSAARARQEVHTSWNFSQVFRRRHSGSPSRITEVSRAPFIALRSALAFAFAALNVLRVAHVIHCPSSSYWIK